MGWFSDLADWWDDFRGPDPSDPDDIRNYDAPDEFEKYGPSGSVFEEYEPSEWDEVLNDDFDPFD